MFKKVMGVFLICLLIAGGATYAATPESEAEEEVMELTLERAIEIAMEKNPEINLQKIAMEKAEVGLKEAKSAADKIEKAGLDSVYENALIMHVTPLEAENNVFLAKKMLEFKSNYIKMSVEKAYYDVLKTRTELENAEDAVKRAEEQLRLAKVALEAGTVANLEVINAEVALAGKKVAVTAARNAYEAAVMDFNDTLGLPLETKIKLTSSFEFEPYDVQVDEVIAKAKEISISYLSAQANEEIAEKNFEVVKKFYPPIVYKYRQAEYDYQRAQLSAEDAGKELELSVKKAYLNLASAAERYGMMQKALKQAEESYRLTKLRYEVGMSTQLDMEEAGDVLDEARAQLLSALYDYNLATAQFRYLVFVTTATNTQAGGM